MPSASGSHRRAPTRNAQNLPKSSASQAQLQLLSHLSQVIHPHMDESDEMTAHSFSTQVKPTHA